MSTIIKKKIKNKYYYYKVDIKRIDGKPRYRNQVYLGPVEKVLELIDAGKSAESINQTPIYSDVLAFADIVALYDIASRLNITDLIDSVIPKRKQGVPIGKYMLAAAINRAVEPTSKVGMESWFNKTILPKLMDIDSKSLSSQRFWDNMSLITDEAIEKFEDVFVKKVVETYSLSTSCLIYDATNFFTFIDTNNDIDIAKRGHCKQKRNDLKIIGLSMMISPDENIPLFYDVYPGNTPDSNQFNSVIEKLKSRFQSVLGKSTEVTLVFDKGNNSEENIELLYNSKFKMHFVGSLRLSQCPELLDIKKSEYLNLNERQLKGVSAYRTRKNVYGKNFTIVITHNPELLAGQIQGIKINIEKAISKLKDIATSLDARANGTVTKGKKPTKESLEKKIKDILKSDYLSQIIDVELSCNNGFFKITYSYNESNFENIKEKHLGKTILFTDHHEWSDESIVSAYRSAWHIEHAFRQMKDTEHLSVRPLYHWTSQKIKVHIFYCVLAFRLCCLLKKELASHNLDMSINSILSNLKEIQQVINYFKASRNKIQKTYSLSRASKEACQIFNIQNLQKYQLS